MDADACAAPFEREGREAPSGSAGRVPGANGAVRRRSTTTECQPVAPSGNGGARSSGWVAPVPSVALTSRVWRPGVASHGQTHWRQVSALCSAASRAGRQGPPSARTSTRRIPRCWAHATPATATCPAGQAGQRPRGVDAGHGLDRRLAGPAAPDPVGVEVAEAGQLQVDQPLGGRHVAVQARDQHPHREPVGERQRLAVHGHGQHGVAAVEHGGGRGADGEPVGRPGHELVGPGSHPGLPSRSASGTPTHRAVPT